MYCTGCGSEIAESSKFCGECGSPAATPPPAAGGTLSGGDTVVAGPTTAPPRRLEPGERFAGRYEIRRRVGGGGMGTVYLAADDLSGEDVCLKVVRPELVADAALAKRFVREGTLSRRLSHRGIVRVFDIAEHDGAYYLTMEHVEGRSLRDWLREAVREEREVPLEAAAGVSVELLAGLAEAHGRGVVHRDLKPENVLLPGDPFEGDHRVKILDFGIARALDSGEALTEPGALLGTPVYMAPEQKTGAEGVGPEADLYAVGVMLYEMLMEVPPEGRWELPSRVREDLPEAVDEVCAKALNRHPRRRYRRAGEMAAAVRALPAGDLVERAIAVRDDDPEEAVRLLRRAAERGAADAQCRLGTCYALGEGVEEDPEEALRWFRLAAEQGDELAAEALARREE